MISLKITLNQAEADALGILAASELRDVRDQIRYILRRELKRQKLLPDHQVMAKPQDS